MAETTGAAAARPAHLGFLGSGSGLHVRRWLAAVAETGLRVTLYTYDPPAEPPAGVAVCVLPRPTRPLRASWLDFWGGSRRLRARLAADGVDVLVASYATSYGLLGLRTGFRPLVVQTWTRDVSIYPFVGPKRHLLGPVVRRVLAGADRILTDGSGLAEAVAARFPETAGRVVPLRWGVRVEAWARDDAARSAWRAAHGIPADAPVVVSGRGVDHWYRPEAVLPALEALLAERPAAHAVVLTLGHPRPDAVDAHLRALAAHPRAVVVDRFLAPDEVRAVWSAGDVLVSVPSADGVSESVLEGMAAGLVPVVSDIASNRSFLTPGRSALFVAEPAAADLAAVLVGAVDRLPELHATFVPRNRAWVRAHASVEATARTLAGLVRALASDASLGRDR